MLYRNLNNPSNATTYSSQDGKLLSLLVELLNNTDSAPCAQNNDSDSEVDWWQHTDIESAGWYTGRKEDGGIICLFFLKICWVLNALH